MAARYDALATPGSQYGYTGNPADAPIDMSGFKSPVSPVSAFQQWLTANNGSAPSNQLGSGAFGMDYSSPIATPALTAPVGPPAVVPRSIWDSPLQQKNPDGSTSGGYLSAGLGLAQGLGSLYLGMQQYNLAKDTLANNKSQFERNFAAQKATTNAELSDRQRARVASNAGAYQSVGDYMSQNGIK